MVVALMREFSQVPARLHIGAAPAGPNPKVCNLIPGYELARHDLILISDSNVRVWPGYLSALSHCVREDVGVVTAVVAGIHGRGLGGRLEAAYLNTCVARWMWIAYAIGYPCVIGKTMLFRRSVMNRFGGLRNLAKYVAEDYMAGQAMHRLGYRVELLREPVGQYIGTYSFKAFWNRHLRWGRIRRSQSPPGFLIEPLNYAFGSGLLGAWGFWQAFSMPFFFFLFLHLFVWGAADALMIRRMEGRISAKTIAAWFLREVLALPHWLHMLSSKRICWRGASVAYPQRGVGTSMKFLWGVATSSHQIEGGNCANDWWAWELAGNIETGEVSGRATDHRNRFEEDLRNAASLGLNTYRFSIEWSRIEPSEGQWNAEAFDWYARIISLCEELGLMPMVTLHHFTLPKWLADRGGITSPHFAERFNGYVRKIAQAFGARVPLWCTVNEPMLLVIGAYLGAIMPPARVNPKQVAAGHSGMLKAHVAAYDTLHQTITHREGPWKDVPLSVGLHTI